MFKLTIQKSEESTKNVGVAQSFQGYIATQNLDDIIAPIRFDSNK